MEPTKEGHRSLKQGGRQVRSLAKTLLLRVKSRLSCFKRGSFPDGPSAFGPRKCCNTVRGFGFLSKSLYTTTVSLCPAAIPPDPTDGG